MTSLKHWNNLQNTSIWIYVDRNIKPCYCNVTKNIVSLWKTTAKSIYIYQTSLLANQEVQRYQIRKFNLNVSCIVYNAKGWFLHLCTAEWLWNANGLDVDNRLPFLKRTRTFYKLIGKINWLPLVFFNTYLIRLISYINSNNDSRFVLTFYNYT